ncbi:MAG: outer membrane protein assembly factor YaeT precursor [Myxococcaceae bacterium]|nr:outer membrane protein assembly factor YaeT precursor [Myxococcaceae bacterium]
MLGLACVPGAGPAHADVPADWTGAPVVAVQVLGDAAGSVDQRELGVPIGAPLNRALLRAALERLGNQGRWSDIQVDAVRVEDGVALLFKLLPRLVVKRVDVVGNTVIENRDVQRVVGLHEASEIDRERFPELISALQKEYATRGYYGAEVKIILRDTDDPALKVFRLEIDEGPPTTIASVVFRGDSLPRRRGVRRLLGVGVGAPADLTRIQEGLEKTQLLLRRSGYHAAALGDATLERTGLRARVVVHSQVGPRFEVRFEGAGPISASELYAALALDQERFQGEGSLRGVEQKVSDLYRRYGFGDVKVQARANEEIRKLPSTTPNELWEERVMIIHVHIERGTQLEVDAVTFPGASFFSTSFLREQVFSYLEEELPGSSLREPVDSALVDQIGLGGAREQHARELKKPLLLDSRKLFHAPTYDKAIEHIRELYRADGFLDVEVSEVVLEPLEQAHHAIAVITIDEGSRTFLHDVTVENNRYLSGRVLLSAAGLTRDAPFSYLKLEEARLRMLAACQEEGYFFAKIEPSVRRSDDGTRAEVTFRVDEGYQVRVGAVEIHGIERSKRSMVRNRIRMVPGDLYRPSLARETQDALLRLDVFSSATVAPDEPNLPARVKTLVITVTERKTQWLGWSGGFSTGEGVRGGFEYGYRNLFGSAVHASFRGQISYQTVFLDKEIERRYQTLSNDQRVEYQTTLTLGVPYLPRAPRVTVGVDLTALADIQRDFRMQKEAAITSGVYRPSKGWTFTAAEELEFSDFHLFVPQTINPLNNVGNLTISDLVPEGANTLLSTQFGATWDHRDRAFNPRHGFIVSATSEWARTLATQARSTVADGAGGHFNSNLLRFTGSFAFYIPLGSRVTFASQTRYGRVVQLVSGSESYPNRKFYLGGTNFRGYYQNQVVPQDLKNGPTNTTGVVSRGADEFIATQNELRFPLYGELYGGIFADVGNLWANPKNFDLRQLNVVYGVGLRFQTPVASLAFDYGVRAIQLDPFRVAGAFQFAFQTF